MRIDARQRWVDAAVAELQHQLGADAVTQRGTHVKADGVFKMMRVIEAAVRAGFEDHGHIFDALVDTLAMASRTAKGADPSDSDFVRFHAVADDALKAVRDVILRELDPLP